MKKTSGNILVVVLLAIVAIAASGTVGFWWRQRQTTTAPVQTPVEEKKNLQPLDETANWKTYTSPNNHFSIKLAQNWFPHEIKEPFGYETAISYPVDFPSPQNWLDNQVAETTISTAKSEGKTIDQIANRQMNQPYSPLVAPARSIIIDNQQALVINSKDGNYRFYVVQKAGLVYEITLNINPRATDESKNQSLALFDQILSTFKFINSSETSFECPQNGWLNCMPILTPEAQKQCDNVEWFQKNCPNFQGVAR